MDKGKDNNKKHKGKSMNNRLIFTVTIFSFALGTITSSFGMEGLGKKVASLMMGLRKNELDLETAESLSRAKAIRDGNSSQEIIDPKASYSFYIELENNRVVPINVHGSALLKSDYFTGKASKEEIESVFGGKTYSTEEAQIIEKMLKFADGKHVICPYIEGEDKIITALSQYKFNGDTVEGATQALKQCGLGDQCPIFKKLMVEAKEEEKRSKMNKNGMITVGLLTVKSED